MLDVIARWSSVERTATLRQVFDKDHPGTNEYQPVRRVLQRTCSDKTTLTRGAVPPATPVAKPRTAHNPAARVRHSVDEEGRRGLGRDALALLVDGVAVEAAGADAHATAAALEVESL